MAPSNHPYNPLQKPFVSITFVSIILISLFISGALEKSTTLFAIVLVVIGALLGATLNFFYFGFSSGFRSFISNRKTIGLRAIIVMLAVAILLFTPLLATQSINGQDYHGFIRPLSLSIPIGAFIFGIGMQISCGCTSGTLNRLGQLQPLALPTLVFMIIGGSIAAATFGSWSQLPAIEPIAFQHHFSWPLALTIQVLILAALWLFLLRLEKNRHGKVEPLFSFRGKTIKHPFLGAALSLAMLNALLFLISGSPWSISSVFPFWGTKAIDFLSIPIDWGFWDYALENQTQINLGILENPVSLTTIGVITGALLITLTRERVREKCAKKALFASSLGGLIMGYSAVLASGCNIGAFFSGIASGSLHGWVWFLFAFIGNVIGVQIRMRYLKT